jgi:hypothetical protein
LSHHIGDEALLKLTSSDTTDAPPTGSDVSMIEVEEDWVE